jgi:hypothetical protein
MTDNSISYHEVIKQLNLPNDYQGIEDFHHHLFWKNCTGIYKCDQKNQTVINIGRVGDIFLGIVTKNTEIPHKLAYVINQDHIEARKNEIIMNGKIVKFWGFPGGGLIPHTHPFTSLSARVFTENNEPISSVDIELLYIMLGKTSYDILNHLIIEKYEKQKISIRNEFNCALPLKTRNKGWYKNQDIGRYVNMWTVEQGFLKFT